MRFPSIDTPSALIMRLTNTNFRNACVGYLGDTDAVHHVWFPSIWDYAIFFGVMYAEPFLGPFGSQSVVLVVELEVYRRMGTAGLTESPLPLNFLFDF